MIKLIPLLKEDEHDRIDPDQRWDKVPQLPSDPMGDSNRTKTVQLAKEILKRTQHLQFDMDQPLVREINKLVSEIILLNEN